MKIHIAFIAALFFAGCTTLSRNNQSLIPKLTERNRLLGVLLPERSCYDVQHYDINMDIDVQKKYIKGYVDFTAIAVNNFTMLQVDLAKSMQLNGVWYQDNQLSTSRKEDAILVEFPK